MSITDEERARLLAEARQLVQESIEACDRVLLHIADIHPAPLVREEVKAFNRHRRARSGPAQRPSAIIIQFPGRS